MSSPGYFYGDQQTQQPSMQQQLAMALMNNGGQQQQSPGASIGQAILMKSMQNRQAQQAYNQAPL